MSVNSLESLLARMRQGSVTQGWGAVSVFSRGRVNRLLEQQYIERFNGHSFLPPFSGRIAPAEGSQEFVELKSIGLGQPLLSFNSASLTNSTAVLTMNIIAGRYTASRQTLGAPATLLSAFNITEQQGFKLEMDIDLSLVVGEIDRRGNVRLNLSEAVNFRCNLAGDDELANARFASYFKQRFEELPEHRSVFQLGMLDLKGYHYLTPQSFRILTQAAPGAKVLGAENYGDGGVVVFIRLVANTSDGQFPPDASFPYLIPDNKEADGSDRYSATLVLSEEMIQYIEGDQLEVLNKLLFPGENRFEERERHVPLDLGVFGNISPRQTRISLEPAFKTIKAGDTQQLTLRDWKGQAIAASSWSAVSLQSHTKAGHGTIANGLYTAASRAQIGHDSLHVVVTAKYVNEGVTYSASALLLVAFDEMTVAPRLATFAAANQAQPIVLTASTAAASPVNWALLTPELGALVQSGNQGRFTPDARARTKGLMVQRVEASGGEKRQSSLVLVNAQQQLKIDPPYIPALKNADNVQLKDDPSLLPGVPRRWKVISGGGTVDVNGRFTAPAQGATSSSVVQCEIVRNGVVLCSGYSVVDLSELEPEPTWRYLAQFTVKVPGGLDNERLGSLFSNGYQQLLTQILVETRPEDGVSYPLSVIEKASMRLVEDPSKDDMEFVGDGLQGIPEGDVEKWRAHLASNRFELAFPRMTRQGDSVSNEPAISVQEIYVHTREEAGLTKTFHAAFQADRDQEWHRTIDHEEKHATIQLTPLAIPVFTLDDYLFKRVRVDGGSGGPGGSDDDDFDYHLCTVDYWTLQYTGRPGGLQGTKFETCEFLPIGGKYKNTSTIRWESEQYAETMFSWTGSIFQDPDKPNVSKIEFDQVAKHVVAGENLNIGINSSFFEQGTLVISLHRSDKVPYIRDTTAKTNLSQDLAVLLIDKRGNAHRRRISFLPKHTIGSRNRLEHIAFTPVS